MNRRNFLNAGLAASAAAMTHRVRAAAQPQATASAAASIADDAGFAQRLKFVATAFGEIACVEQGSGPAALFLHGFPLNGFQWRDALRLLAPRRRCIAPDFLGMGHTRVAPSVGLAPESQMRMLVALLDELGVASADVIANDSGGAVAQILLAHHPERVRSLLLTNGDSAVECPPAAMGAVIDLARQGRYAQEWLVPWLRDPALARSERGIGGMCYAHRAHPTDTAVATYFTPLTESPARLAQTDRFALALAANTLADIGPALRACTVPVGIVWGMDDTIFSAKGLAHLAHAFGGLRWVERLEGYRLFWPEERPDLICEHALRLWGTA